MRRIGISIAGLSILLLLAFWFSTTSKAAPITTPTPGIQASPLSTDPTAIALQKALLTQQVEQVHHQNDWIWNNLSALATAILSIIAIVGGALFGFFRWLGERRDQQTRWLHDRQVERERRSEQSFQTVIEGLSSEDLPTKVGAAIMLRTFLRPDYEQFYSQVFDLAVAHLRFHKRADLSASEPLRLLIQALTKVFRESFPKTRDFLQQHSQILDATSIQLAKADLAGADLKRAWMPEAYLREANLKSADLDQINLERANLTGADLAMATLTNANLIGATLVDATLEHAELADAILDSADLTGANLTRANLTRAALTEEVKLTNTNLTGANLTGADLTGADLASADFTDADLTKAVLSDTNLMAARSLIRTKISDALGLTEGQREACAAKGAVI